MAERKAFFGLWSIAFITLFCNSALGQEASSGSRMRVLGYLFSHNNWANEIDSIDLSQITDLNLAFINPDASGRFAPYEGFIKVIQKAHANKVRVFMSIGGGNPPPHLEQLMHKENRTTLVNAVVAMCESYSFDGVDVDIENNLINADYPYFVAELAEALRPKNKLITTALASWNSNLVHDSTLKRYDYINIMCYDKTGPWNRSKPGQHAPFSMVQEDFEYFNKTRGIPAEKLLIGLPFYGYGFGRGVPESLSYKDICNTYPGSVDTDSVTIPVGGTIYYNGRETIRKKTSFAILNNLSGVMIWQLSGDSRDSTSLLKLINSTIELSAVKK